MGRHDAARLYALTLAGQRYRHGKKETRLCRL